MTTVGAVVVTRNRQDPLARTVRSLLEQSRPPEQVLVVDSGSTEPLPPLDPSVEVLRLDDNVGFGAALAAGMRHLRGDGLGPDLLWLLDDDSPVDPGSLAAALGVLEGHPEIGLLANRGGGLRLGVPQHGTLPVGVEPRTAESTLLDGSLVRREVVDRCGFPREDLFMVHEDLEYSTRVAAAGFGLAVSGAVVSRPEHLGSTEPGRNAWRLYYQSRNHVRIALDRSSAVWLAGAIGREVRIAAAAVAGGRWSSARAVVLGAADGFRGRMGRTVEPGQL